MGIILSPLKIHPRSGFLKTSDRVRKYGFRALAKAAYKRASKRAFWWFESNITALSRGTRSICFIWISRK